MEFLLISKFRYGSALAQLEEQLLLACAAHEDVAAAVGECHVAGSHGGGGEMSVGGVADLAAPGGIQQTHPSSSSHPLPLTRALLITPGTTSLLARRTPLLAPAGPPPPATS